MGELNNHALYQVCSRVNHTESNFSFEVRLALLQCCYTSGHPEFSNEEVATPGFLWAGWRKRVNVCWGAVRSTVTAVSSDHSGIDQSLGLGALRGHIHTWTPAGKSPSWLPCLCPNVSHPGISKFTSYTIVTPWIARFSWQKAILYHSKLNWWYGKWLI